MNVNSTSGGQAYGILSAQSAGLSGLASGMDTESMVEKMLSGQQMKIDKQKANKQTTEWKQTMYRDVITKINAFQNKFFDLTSKNAINTNSFFNQMSSTTKSSAFSVTGTSSAISGEMRLKIDQLATTTTVSGKNLESVDMLKGSFDASAFVPKVAFNMGAIKIATGNKDTDGKEIYETYEATDFELNSTEIERLMKGEEITKSVERTDKDSPTKHTEKVSFKLVDGEITTTRGLSKVVAKASGLGSNSLGLQMLGMGAGSAIGEKNSKGEAITFSAVQQADIKHTINFTLDGVKKSIEIKADQTVKGLQDSLDFAFGKGAIKVENTGTDTSENAKLSSFKLTTDVEGRKIVIDGSGTGLETLSLKNGMSNNISVGNTLGEVFGLTATKDAPHKFTINGKSIEVSSEDTISDFMSKINNSGANVSIKYDDYTNSFMMTQKSSGKGFEIGVVDDQNFMSQVLGFKNNESYTDIKNSAQYTAGQNAQFELNGVKSERSTNTFNIRGVNITLNAKNTEAETITTVRDNDSIVSGIKAFVDDYNALVKELYELTREKSTYKDYPPLTDAQRKEMSESEITAWEKKAKEGLLRSDSEIETFLSSMRLALYEKPVGNSVALYDIGIETKGVTAGNFSENYGQIAIDEGKLREMVEADPEGIQRLFTYEKTKKVIGSDGKEKTVADGAQGIATAFKSIAKAAANTSTGSPGTLVSIAGYANTGTVANNVLSKRLESIKNSIKNLTSQYNLQKNRYWKQFSTMETTLSNLSSQSSWLTQFQ